MPDLSERRSFWTSYQPGFRFSGAEPGTAEFFDEVERHRYSLEPHIPDVVGFERWSGCDVLEGGCGIATDGIRFARAGARYVGFDFSETALELARRRFDAEGRRGEFVQGSLTSLPFDDDSFDLVFSHGVVHHLPETERAIAEFRRVLRPGGTALVMVYHRNSLNYYVNVLGVRRLLAALLPLPGGTRLAARLSGEPLDVLEGHRRLLHEHGVRYLRDSSLFLSNNTDGPGNPLSKAYSRRDAHNLFAGFVDLRTEVRFLNLRMYPFGDRLARTAIARRLERRIGWHLYAEARKP